jgi:thioredoxin-like negative regulator of GroEL
MVLRRAVELDPNDGPTAMHLALALRDNGKAEESRKYFALFRQLGGDQKQAVPRGLLDFLSLTPAQQRERYLANLTRAVAESPLNAELRLRLGTLLIDEGRLEEGSARWGRSTATNVPRRKRVQR